MARIALELNPDELRLAMSTSRPDPATTRIEVLDVLRGIALLGMYVVHFGYYMTEPPAGAEPGAAAKGVEQVIALLFEDRFYPMFGMLFGISFAIQLGRADARGEHFVPRFLRRLAALAVFGFIAEGIFGYNVLFGYAMWGVFLIPIRRWPVRRLVVLFLLCAASRPLWNLGRLAIASTQAGGIARYQAAREAQQARFTAARAAHEEAGKAPDWKTVIRGRLAFMPEFHRQWSLLPWGSFTLFLLGLIGFRLHLFDAPEQHRRLIVALMAAGATSWAIDHFVLPIGGPPGPLPEHGVVLHAAATSARINAFALIREQWLAWTYMGVVLLAVARNRAWLRRLAPFAWTGRMALTNYMMQVILVDVLFTPHGLNGSVAPPMVPVGALLLFAVQALFGRWWLARYGIGPLEWVWRSATYWKWQPLGPIGR